MRRRCLLLLAILSLASFAAAVPPAPPTPKGYDVQIAYRIHAFRNERLPQYAEMMRYLKGLGFQRDPADVAAETEPEDVKHIRLRGTIPAKRAREILDERHIYSILLVPHGTKLPEDKTQRVRVNLELADGLNPEGQRLLSEQTFEVLAGLQFRGGVGYDHRGYTRLVGSLPVSQLETLLTDLREQPAGKRQPRPFASVWPVRVTEVLPSMPLPIPRPRPPQVPKGQENLSPDLRELLLNADRAAKPIRLEVILAATPPAENESYRDLLTRAAPDLIVEGQLGALISVVVAPSQAVALAALPEVAGVRLPRLPQPAAGVVRWRPLLHSAAAARLPALSQGGRGTRLAVVDSDFRGWQTFLGKGLPAKTRILDLTAERNADLQGDPFPAGGEGVGRGTRHALAIARLVPQIDLTLIRIDAAAPYMLEEAARAINGDPVHSINLENRLAQLKREQTALDKRRDALLEERREAFADFREEGEAAARRKAYLDKQKAYDRDRVRFHTVLQRYLQYQREVRSLHGIRVVASALTWNDGFPVDGTSTLSRYFDDRPFRAALWFQAIGDTRGQSWADLFRDADGNGVMEFAAPDQPLPAELWTPELNYLSWRTPNGQTVADIPAGTRLRITLQWREAHDPSYAQTGEDPFRLPLALLRLVLMRQLDPAGARQPADDLEVVAQSVGYPQRLVAAANSAVYEITLEVQVKQAGRYAVRIEGRAPDSIYPPGDATLPAMRKRSELHVRLFVAPLDAKGRAVLRDFATATGSIGMPGDARAAIAVGPVD